MRGCPPEEEGPVVESMMAVLKCSWLKDAATERLMRSISLNVSSLPYLTCTCQDLELSGISQGVLVMCASLHKCQADASGSAP